ncbi:MAG: hypothetical protein ABGW82_02350, partial [Paracoccus sp. (in: a-proteobacteria)]
MQQIGQGTRLDPHHGLAQHRDVGAHEIEKDACSDRAQIDGIAALSPEKRVSDAARERVVALCAIEQVPPIRPGEDIVEAPAEPPVSADPPISGSPFVPETTPTGDSGAPDDTDATSADAPSDDTPRPRRRRRGTRGGAGRRRQTAEEAVAGVPAAPEPVIDEDEDEPEMSEVER